MKSPNKGKLPGAALRADGFRRAVADRPIPDLLAALNELEATTRPQDGAGTARGKDKKAVLALRLANQLVRAVAGWAIDHQMGLALQEQGSALEVIPELGGHPLLSVALAKVDDHRHEQAGVEMGAGRLTTNVSRQALRNLLRTNPGAFPEFIARQVVHAINALDYNEIHPILELRKERRKVGLSEINMQLDALMWVAHYVGRGFRKKEALQRVADAFGVSIATLRSWNRRVREDLGQLLVDNHLENASCYDDDYEDAYDRELISSGKTYRQILKQKK